MTEQKINPKNPDPNWFHSYCYPSLLEAKPYAIDIVPNVKMKLDQNECPWDFPAHLKDKILNRVRETSWNRYPNPMADHLTAELADYVGVPRDCLLTGPGSNHLITLIIDTLGHNLKGKVVIARPSFPLFESHCRYSGVAYEPWELGQDLEYDLKKLPELPEGSLVIFASPNNPTGTSLSHADFEKLLRQHPKTMFVADEAYYEFAGETYSDLLAKYSNLLIIRTLSKTMGAAGVRLGYIMAAAPVILEIGKLRLPFLLNHFTVEAVMTILKDPEIKDFVQRNINNAREERERIYQSVRPHAEKNGFEIKNSKANFLLLRWQDSDKSTKAYKHLIANRILVRDISRGPKLAGCLRASVGTREENDALIKALNSVNR